MRQHLATPGDASTPRAPTDATASSAALAALTLGLVGVAVAPAVTAGFGLGASGGLWLLKREPAVKPERDADPGHDPDAPAAHPAD